MIILNNKHSYSFRTRTRCVLLFHLSVTDLPNCERLISAFPISNSWKKTVADHIYFFMSACQKCVDQGPERKAERQADSFRRAYGKTTATTPDLGQQCSPLLSFGLWQSTKPYTLKQIGNLLTYLLACQLFSDPLEEMVKEMKLGKSGLSTRSRTELLRRFTYPVTLEKTFHLIFFLKEMWGNLD